MFSSSRLIMFILMILLILFFILIRFKKFYSKWKDPRKTIAFFHPYTNDGGGGERVLWGALQALQRKHPGHKYLIYSGDKVPGSEILKKAKRTFKLDINEDVEFVFLRTRAFTEGRRYPFLTLLCQSLGTVVLGLEALWKYPTDVVIDSMGLSFTYPAFKYLGGCSVVCYIHFPTISTDMLNAISLPSFNNRKIIANSKLLSQAKLIYYRMFSYIYGMVGRTADCIMVNSSWTKSHILSLFKCPSKTFLLYPPCNASNFQELPLNNRNKSKILSISQFRPEKDHLKQLMIVHDLKERLAKYQFKLTMVGSTRNIDDEKRLDSLISKCAELGIRDNVEFKINVSFEELLEEMKTANIGLHTMKSEHFGIGIVECMAAGLIMLANNSGGPKMDIIKPNINGFLASEIDEYVDNINNIISLTDDKLDEIRRNARDSVVIFNDENFQLNFLNIIDLIIT